MVDLHRLQRGLDARAQPLAARVARPVGARVDAALGRDDHRVPVAVELAAQRVGQHLLGLAEAVRLGGVEEVDAEVERVADRPLRLRRRRRNPTRPRPARCRTRSATPAARSCPVSSSPSGRVPAPEEVERRTKRGSTCTTARCDPAGWRRAHPRHRARIAPGHAFPLVPLATALRDAGHEVTFAAGPDVLDGVATTGLAVLPSGGGLFDGFVVARERLGVMTWPPDRATEWTLAREVFGDILPRRVVADLAPWLARRPAGPRGGRDRQPGRGPRGGGRGPPVRPARRRPAPDPAGTDVPPRSRAGAHASPRSSASTWRRERQSRTRLRRHLPALAPGAARRGRAGRAPAAPDRVEPARPGIVTTRVRPTVGLPHAGHRHGHARDPADGRRRARRPRPRRARGRRVGRASASSTGWRADRVRVEPFVAQAELLASEHPPVLVVHHGGSGTTLGAAAAGIPQLFLPQGADQFFNAAAVTEVGAGATLASPDGVAEAAGRADRRGTRARVGTRSGRGDRRDAVPGRRGREGRELGHPEM